MKSNSGYISAVLFFLLAVSACAAELHVFAAASLTDALKDIAPAFEKISHDKLQFNFAGSNILARQIQEGAPADVFFSADEAKMNGLESAGLLLAGSRTSLLSNTLAVIINSDSKLPLNSPKDLAGPGIKNLILADTKGVPAGIYAKEYLEKTGVWESVKDRVVATENVRAALAALEAGNGDAGIVYTTDAAISKTVRIAFEVSASEGPAISYPVAVLKDSKNAQAAEKFVEFLKSEPAQMVFKKFGFGIHP